MSDKKKLVSSVIYLDGEKIVLPEYTFNLHCFMGECNVDIMKLASKNIGLIFGIIRAYVAYAKGLRYYDADEFENIGDQLQRYMEDGNNYGEAFSKIATLITESGFFRKALMKGAKKTEDLETDQAEQ